MTKHTISAECKSTMYESESKGIQPQISFYAARQALPHLARALRENHSLVSLDISNSKIGVEDVTTLARVLDCNTSLQSLIMSKNSIGDQGAAAIGTLLLNSRLTYINLSHCCIRVSGARWFADVLPRAQVCFPPIMLTPS